MGCRTNSPGANLHFPEESRVGQPDMNRLPWTVTAGSAILILARNPVISAWMPKSLALDDNFSIAQVFDS
jgi:hypothetical protein